MEEHVTQRPQQCWTKQDPRAMTLDGMLRDKLHQQAESEALRKDNEELRDLLWRLFTVAEDASTDLIRGGNDRVRPTPACGDFLAH
jgi:hypothetical protein